MPKTTRRAFLTTTAMTATAAAACSGVGASPESANKVRGNPFAQVKDIPLSESHIPSEKYPPPFLAEEYAGRLARVRKAMVDAKVDLLWTGWPDSMLYLHGYEMTWYDPTRNPRIGTAVHVDHDKQILVGGEDVQFSAATDRKPVRAQAPEYGNVVANLLKDEGWLKKGTVVGMEFSR